MSDNIIPVRAPIPVNARLATQRQARERGEPAPALAPLPQPAIPGELLAHALAYAELGWRVVPCHAPRWQRDGRVLCSCGRADCGNVGKHPRTQHGLADAATSADTIRAWWMRWPDANIGLVGVGVVIDIDPRHGGDVAALGLYEREIDTSIQITGSGGHHILYAQPAGHEPFGNQRGNLPIGIDVRGHAGYILAAPSLHASGQRYAWIGGYEPWDTPLLPLPRRLILRIRPPRYEPPPQTMLARAGQRRPYGGAGAGSSSTRPSADRVGAFLAGCVRSAVERVQAAPDGQKHDTLLRAAVDLGGWLHLGLDETEAAQQLYAAIAPRAADRHAARQTILDGLRYGQARPREIPDQQQQQRG